MSGLMGLEPQVESWDLILKAVGVTSDDRETDGAAMRWERPVKIQPSVKSLKTCIVGVAWRD